MVPSSTSGSGPPDAPPDAVLLFGPFEFDPAPRLLYRGRTEVLLPPRAAAVLEVLLRHPGEVLSKEELLNAVWPDAFVGEDSLTQALSIVRHALGDNPRNPRYVETKPKRGYRFIAAVVERPRSEGAARAELRDRTDDPASAPAASTSAVPRGAGGRSTGDASLAVGNQLGRYEIVGRLGAGAMGVVWRARDKVLEREVAIKVLPDELVADNTRIADLEQEARLLASISHPNVAHIHDIADAGGVRFAVLELVEGETLDERLRAGGLSVTEAIELGCQIAAGMEAAHQRGVVHRDLKPANIALTQAGEAKVLDFGLATSLEVTVFEAAGSAVPTPDITVGGSYRGAIVGTAAYMSPEQARGRGADQRSDIWAFGCILFEMLSGTKAFERDTVADTFASIVHQEPDLEALPAAVPPLARSVLRRCLRKDPRQRLRDIGDARLELEEALAAPAEHGLSTPAPAPGVGRRAIPWSLLVVAVAVAAWGVLRPHPPAPGPVTHLSMELAAGQRLTGGSPLEAGMLGLQRPSRAALALSPDGSYLVYAATVGNDQQLYARPLDQQVPTPIPGTDGASSPFFSPDGEWIGFYAAGDWKAVRAGGGEARTVLAGAPPPFGASWGDDDGIVIAAGEASGLVRVPATGGAAEPLTELDGAYAHRLPHVLPGSSAVLFTVLRDTGGESAEVVVKSLRTREVKVLIEDAADARYLPSGHLVFARQGTLMAVPFDLDSLELAGEPVRVLEDVMQATGASHSVLDTGAAQFSLADTGTLAYAPGGIYPAPSRSLVLVDPQGESRSLPLPSAGYSSPRVSPDGSRIAYLVGRRARWDIWVYDVARAIPQRLTFDGSGGALAWSPDGLRLVVSSDRHGGATNLYSMAAGGGGDPVRLTTSEGSQFVSSWARSGLLALVERDVDIVVVGSNGGEQTLGFAQSPAQEQWPVFSPDGEWLAYGSDETGRNEVYVRPYPGPDPAVRISTDGGESPAWSHDGSRLYYRGQGRMMAVDVSADGTLTYGRPVVLFDASPYLATTPTRGYDVTPAGDFVMVTRGDDTPQPVTRIRVVLNWLDELRRRAPSAH